MKTIILSLISTLIFSQFSFSQLLVNCGKVNVYPNTKEIIVSLNANDCNENLKITIDESKLSVNDIVKIEGDVDLDSGEPVHIIGKQNYSILISPFDRNNNSDMKVVYYKGGLPDEKKTVIRTSRKEFKHSPIRLIQENVIVYPNPADINITIQAETILNYTLRNNYGAILLQKYFPDSNTIDVSNLHKGIYNIKIQTLQQVVTRKIIKN
jgi:hypothetical protein